MSPCSLPKATTDPVKVTAPTKIPTNVSIRWISASVPSTCIDGSSVTAKPTSTAAAPTKLCSMATICGIDVICTRAATAAPTPPPRASIRISRP
jgi:hypothetical protein